MEQFSYAFGKKIKKDIIPRPVWPESFLDALESLSKILKMEGHKLLVESDAVTVRVTDWEIRKAIAKAGIADCGIVTTPGCCNALRLPARSRSRRAKKKRINTAIYPSRVWLPRRLLPLLKP
jgi:hypothetical protein